MPKLRPKVRQLVEIFDVHGKTNLETQTNMSRRITVSGIFNVWSLNFTRLLSNFKKGSKCFFSGVEPIGKYAIAKAIPSSLYNLKRTIGFTER